MSRIDASASGIRTELPEAAEAIVRKKAEWDKNTSSKRTAEFLSPPSNFTD